MPHNFKVCESNRFVLVYSDTGTPIPPPPKQTTSKRSADLVKNTQRRPCPKRFKKLLAPIPEASSMQGIPSQQRIPDNQLISKNKSIVPAKSSIAEVIPERDMSSELKSSESIAENDIFVNSSDSSESSGRSKSSLQEQHRSITSNRSLQSLHSLSSKEIPNKQAGASSPSNRDTVNSQPKTSVRHEPSSEDIPNPETIIPSDTINNQPQTTIGHVPHPSKAIPIPQVPSGSKTDKNLPKKSVPPKSRPKVLYQDDSDSDVAGSSNQHTDQRTNPEPHQQILVGVVVENTVDDTVGSPSAPPVRNPRIRQDNANMARDLRQYFSTNVVDVNNYARTLAG